MTTSERRLLRSLSVFALTLLVVHLIVRLTPSSWAVFWYPQNLIGPDGIVPVGEWLWGAYPFSHLSRWLQWMLAGVTTGATIWLGFALSTTISAPRLRFPSRNRTHIVVALLSIPLFYLARIRHTNWGDSYIIVKAIAHPEVRFFYNWQAPLDTIVHASLFRYGEAHWGWLDALPAYWILSSLAGGVAVWALLRLALDVGRDDLERWLLFGFLITLGSVQLFFGYPENYTFISVLMIVFFWLGWRFIHGRSSLWLVSLILALANGNHPVTVALQPALWFLAWWGWRRRGLGLGRMALELLLPPLIIGGGVFAIMSAGGHGLASLMGPEAPGGGDHHLWVPMSRLSTKWEHYTMFSRSHLMDILNEQLLTAPFTLFTLAMLLLLFFRKLPSGAYTIFLSLAAGALLLWTFTWNADYGGRQDWDLFSIAAWPATLLMGYWLTRALSAPALLRSGLIIIANQFLYTAVWVYTNTRPWAQ